MDNITTMTKKVNVVARIPIRTVTPPMHGIYNGIAMTPANILKCLNHRAVVHEILSDGTKVLLTGKNYNTDNSHLMKSRTASEVKKDVLQSAVVDEDPVAPGKIVKGEEDPVLTTDTVNEENPMDTKTVEFKVGEDGKLEVPPEVDETNKKIQEVKDSKATLANEEAVEDPDHSASDDTEEIEPEKDSDETFDTTVNSDKEETEEPKVTEEKPDAETVEKPKVEDREKATNEVNKKKSGSTRKKK